MVCSTVSRSSVELRARPTSPSAVSSSTERVSSAVRACSSVKQAGVLDRDDRLIGEGLQQRDLLVGERPDLAADDHDGADELALAEHRDSQRVRYPANGDRSRQVNSESAWRSRTWTVRRSRATPSHTVPRRDEARPRCQNSLSSAESPCSAATLSDLAVKASRRGRVGRRRAVPAFSTSVSNTGWRSNGEPTDHVQDFARRRLLLEGFGLRRLMIAVVPAAP